MSDCEHGYPANLCPICAAIGMPELVVALRNQRQLDVDGCHVGVSRQALDEAVEIILRYEWLLARAGQIGAHLWPHAPWIHESREDNQARFELCIDESRLDEMEAV